MVVAARGRYAVFDPIRPDMYRMFATIDDAARLPSGVCVVASHLRIVVKRKLKKRDDKPS